MNYMVKCKQCGKADTVIIDNRNSIKWGKTKFIISGRYRLDMHFGWQCICGNNDIVTKQESREIENLQAPNPSDISKVLRSITPDKPKFIMEAI